MFFISMKPAETRRASPDNPEEGLFYLAVEKGPTFTVLSVNQALCNILGVSPTGSAPQLDVSVLAESCRSAAREYFAQAIVERTSVSWESSYIRQGREQILRVSVMPLFQAELGCTHLVGSVHDITQAHRIEHALREETRTLELLNDNGRTIASNLDLQALLQAVTDGATRLTGAKFGAFFYTSTDENGEALMLYTLSGAPQHVFDKLGKPRATPLLKLTYKGEGIIRSDDITADPRYGRADGLQGMPLGHLKVRSYLAAPVVSRAGSVVGALLFGHPEPGIFTEKAEKVIAGVAAQAAIAIDNARLYEAAQKAAQEREQLLQSERSARAEAERLSKMKDEFLAMLAHELRNPLAPITSAAERLSTLRDVQQQVVVAGEMITRQVAHMSRIVDDLLDVSRVTRGLVTLSKKVLNLKDVVDEALDQAGPLIEGKGHQVMVNMPYSPVYVEGDHTRLVQAVSNILNNAVKYTDQSGEIHLTLTTANGQAALSVRDNGSGMSEDLVPEVFELFAQGKRTLARSQGGLGLGLALVKRLVELHEGSVAARSEGIGHGSEFELRLPLTSDKPQPSDSPILAPARLSLEDSSTAPLKVIVIDDNKDAAASLSILLKDQGHSVRVGHTGTDGLELAAAESVDLCLVDIGLPDMDGYQVIEQLKNHPHTATSVFVAISGYGQENDLEKSRSAGFDHHLVKPVKIADMSKLIARYMSAGRLPATLSLPAK